MQSISIHYSLFTITYSLIWSAVPKRTRPALRLVILFTSRMVYAVKSNNQTIQTIKQYLPRPPLGYPVRFAHGVRRQIKQSNNPNNQTIPSHLPLGYPVRFAHGNAVGSRVPRDRTLRRSKALAAIDVATASRRRTMAGRKSNNQTIHTWCNVMTAPQIKQSNNSNNQTMTSPPSAWLSCSLRASQTIVALARASGASQLHSTLRGSVPRKTPCLSAAGIWANARFAQCH